MPSINGIDVTQREYDLYECASQGLTKQECLDKLDGINSMSRVNGLTSSLRKKGVEVNWTGARESNNGGETPVEVKTALSDEDRYKIADDMVSPFGRMYVHEHERLNQAAPTEDEMNRAEAAIQAAQDRLAEAQARHEAAVAQHQAQVEAFTEAAKTAGFDFDAYAEAVAQAEEEKRQQIEQAREAAKAAS